MRIFCYTCRKSVSSEVLEGTIFRAIATCPECIEKEPSNSDKELSALRAKIKLLEYRQILAQKYINSAATWLQLAGVELDKLEPPEEEVSTDNPFMLSGEELERAIKKVHDR